MWLFTNLVLKFALKITDIMVYLQRIPHFWPQVVVLDQDTVTIGRLSARNTTSFLLLASKTFNRHASLHACTCRNRKQAMTKYFFPFRSLDWRPIDPPTFILVPPQVQYRANVSWQSLEARTSRLDPRSSILEAFEYRGSSRVHRVSSRALRVSRQETKNFSRD